MKNLLFILFCFLLGSCAKFSDGTSVWSDYLWIIPAALFVGFALSTYRGIKAWKSGWQQDTKDGHFEGDERLPIYKVPQFAFALGFLIALVAVLVYQNSQG